MSVPFAPASPNSDTHGNSDSRRSNSHINNSNDADADIDSALTALATPNASVTWDPNVDMATDHGFYITIDAISTTSNTSSSSGSGSGVILSLAPKGGGAGAGDSGKLDLVRWELSNDEASAPASAPVVVASLGNAHVPRGVDRWK